MVEIKNDILPAQVGFVAETPVIGAASIEPVVPESNITISQPEVILFQTDITPLPVFTETISSSTENIINGEDESHGVPLDSLQDTNTTLSGNVPEFMKNFSVEMAKKGGKISNLRKKKERRELDKIKQEKGVNGRVEYVEIPGRGQVPCKIKGGKATPI